MKKIIFIALLLTSVAYAQKMKYVVAYCTLQRGMNGTKDTVFNGNEGSITAFVDLDAKTVSFDWKMPDYDSRKQYQKRRDLHNNGHLQHTTKV